MAEYKDIDEMVLIDIKSPDDSILASRVQNQQGESIFDPISSSSDSDSLMSGSITPLSRRTSRNPQYKWETDQPTTRQLKPKQGKSFSHTGKIKQELSRHTRPITVSRNEHMPELQDCTYFGHEDRGPPFTSTFGRDDIHREQGGMPNPMDQGDGFSQSQNNYRRSTVKLAEYDGKCVTVDTFIRKADACAAMNHWSELEQLEHMKLSLTGDASQLLQDEGACRSVHDLKLALRVCFGNDEQSAIYKNQLYRIRREPNQTIQQYGMEVARLVRLAYPTWSTDSKREMAIDVFIRSLGNERIEMRLLEIMPQSLADSIRIAVSIEANMDFVMNKSNGKLNEHRKQAFDRKWNRYRVTENEGSEPQSHQLGIGGGTSYQKVRVSSGKGNPLNLSLPQKAYYNSSKNYQYRKDNTERPTVKKKNRAEGYKPVCWSCGIAGHMAYDCPNETDSEVTFKPRKQERTQQKVTKSPVCWNCGKEGHVIQNCKAVHMDEDGRKPMNLASFRDKQRARQEKEQNDRISEKQSKWKPHLETVKERTERLSLRRVNSNNTVTAEKQNRKYKTAIRAKIDGQRKLCVLDTGSGLNIMPARYVKGKHLDPPERSGVTLANGMVMPIVGSISLPVTVKGERLQTKFDVAPNVQDVILGIEWLQDNKCHWNFENNTVKIRKHVVPLKSERNSKLHVRKITAMQDIVVPSWSECVIPCNLSFGNPNEEMETNFATENKSLLPGLKPAKTLLPQHVNNLPVRVINVTPNDISVQEFDEIAAAYPVEIQETKAETVVDVDEMSKKFCDGMSPLVTPEEREQFCNLIKRYKHIFSHSIQDIGCTSLVEHHIRVNTHKPVCQPLRRQPTHLIPEINKQLDEMLEAKIIEPSQSSWASNLTVVKKKSADPNKPDYRVCVDFRQVNQVTEPEVCPLPRIDMCLEALSGSKFFSSLDMRSAYYHVSVHEDSRDYTSFRAPDNRLYRFCRLPFGLSNSPATFARCVNLALQGLNQSVALAYLDDILVHSVTKSAHLSRLQQVFERLQAADFRLKPDKCFFLKESLRFLGFVVDSRGVSTDPEKTQKIRDWDRPRNVTQVKQFIGLVSYYRRYVKDFATIAYPLHALTRKHAKFDWDENCEQAFQKLKQILVNAPVMALPRDEGKFILDCDASNFGIGAVLSQEQDGEEKVIAYASRSLSRAERNYTTTRKELLSIVHFVDYFRCYLLLKPFLIRSDHMALRFLMSLKEPNPQYARWIERLSEYKFEIAHRAGLKHQNADALSRIPSLLPVKNEPDYNNTMVTTNNVKSVVPINRENQGNSVTCDTGSQTDVTVTMYTEKSSTMEQEVNLSHNSNFHQSDANTDNYCRQILFSTQDNSLAGWSKQDIREALDRDMDLSKLKALLTNHPGRPPDEEILCLSRELRGYIDLWDQLLLKDGLIYRRWVDNNKPGLTRLQLVIPNSYRNDLLEHLHGGFTANHIGLRKTMAKVQLRAFWIGWKADVARFVRRCNVCARYANAKPFRKGPMQRTVTGNVMQRLSIDIVGPFVAGETGCKYMFTCMCTFSKFAWAFPIVRHDARTLADILVNKLFAQYGLADSITTDRGVEFESNIFSEICNLLQITKLSTTGYRPQANQVERFHRSLNALVAKAVQNHHTDWEQHIPRILCAYNSSQHDSTGYSPVFLMFGREFRSPVDILDPTDDPQETTYDDFVEFQRDKMRLAYEFVRQELGKSVERNKRYYDRQLKGQKTFQTGDWVFYFYPRKYRNQTPKWSSLWVGPYCILQRIGPVLYRICKSRRSKPFIVHVDKLKPCYGDHPESWSMDEPEPEDNLSVGDPADIGLTNAESLPSSSTDSTDSSDSEDLQDRPRLRRRDKLRRPFRYDY